MTLITINTILKTSFILDFNMMAGTSTKNCLYSHLFIKTILSISIFIVEYFAPFFTVLNGVINITLVSEDCKWCTQELS